MAAGERQFGMQPRDLGVPGQANVRPLAAADREPRGARRQLVDALSPLAVTQHQEGAPGGLGGDPLPQLGGRRGVDVQRRSAGGVGRQGGPDSTLTPPPLKPVAAYLPVIAQRSAARRSFADGDARGASRWSVPTPRGNGAGVDLLDLDAQLSEGERAWRDRMRVFADAELRPHVDGWFERGEFRGISRVRLAGSACWACTRRATAAPAPAPSSTGSRAWSSRPAIQRPPGARR
jgi:hypothetical protein